MEDKEIVVMSEISKAFAQLGEGQDATVDRILKWANARYGRTNVGASLRHAAGGATGENTSNSEPQPFESAADLYHAADPKMEYEKAIVMGYWFQMHQGQPDFGAQEINNALKHIGYQIKNITDAFSSAMSRRPALVIQMQKSGTSRQARKTYKLTHAGIQWVRSKLVGGGADTDAADETVG